MPEPPADLRTRKRLATRQKISDIASRLFVERGFDHVTVDEIAQAAEVSRMTVFNYFARKEDMFFDLDEEGREDLLAAVQARDKGVSPIEALRLFAHWAFAEKRPYVLFFEDGSEHFLKTIQDSEALKARARAIRDELTDLVSLALANAVKRSQADATAKLVAALLVASWEVAFLEAHRVYRQSGSVKKANKAFLAIVDQGDSALRAIADGSPYA
jgi:AcrR family transcriptional regulator